MPDRIAQRFTLAFGGNDHAALRELYDEDVELYGPLTWSLRGRQALLDYDRHARLLHVRLPLAQHRAVLRPRADGRARA